MTGDFLRQRRRQRRGGGGSTVIQMVVVMQVLLIVFFGVVEFGQFLYIRHAFQAAARDAARAASLPTATTQTVIAAATSTLLQANVTLDTSWVTIADIAPDGSSTTSVTDVTTIPSNDRVKVSISTTYGNVPNACRPLFQLFGKGVGGGKPIAGICTAVKE